MQYGYSRATEVRLSHFSRFDELGAPCNESKHRELGGGAQSAGRTPSFGDGLGAREVRVGGAEGHERILRDVQRVVQVPGT